MHVRKSGFITKIVLLVLLVYAIVSLMLLRSNLADAQAANQASADRVAELKQENEEMKYAIEHSGDPETMEDIARDMGYVMPGEQIFIDGGN